MTPVRVSFEKIVPEGKALGYLDGRACFAIGPLPGEVAEVEVVREQKRYVEAVVRGIVEPSPRRQPAREDHFGSCSPWQGVDYDYQLELKQQMLAETFGRPELNLPVLEMLGTDGLFGYRNKLEFSLLHTANRQLKLAFHARNSFEDLIALPEGCVLGSAAMNAAALALLARVNELSIAGYVETLTVRESQTRGGMLGVLALHQVPQRDWTRLAGPEFESLVVSRVRGRSRHELVWHEGEPGLTETVGGVDVSYAYDGFFQTNVPVFERALERILAVIPAGGRVVDLYGGAGTIGLPAAKLAAEVVAVEINAAAVEQAAANAQRAGLTNYRAVAVPAERLDADLLAGADCVIVDPPRAGLHERVAQALLAAAPKRIVYLSCNPVTQARDVMALAGAYRTEGVTGFDFYPGTLHLESLVVLERL